MRGRRLQGILQAAGFGLQPLAPEDLYGGETPEEGRDIFLGVLDGTAGRAREDVVCANAGLAIHVIHPERSLADCTAEARESIRSGAARRVLHKLLGA